MKKLFAILLILALMLCTVGCQQSAFTKAEIAAKYGVEESVIDEWHNKYPKSNDLPSEDSEFADDYVVIWVYPFANEYNFTPEDFPELQCKEVRRLVGPYSSLEEPTRKLMLFLNNSSKTAVIEAIRRLQLRADIYYAYPDYIYDVSGW